jgi:hypothetical protein
MNADEEHITITKTEYESLIRASRFLEHLEASGVDNWDWYGDALTSFYAEYPEYS